MLIVVRDDIKAITPFSSAKEIIIDREREIFNINII